MSPLDILLIVAGVGYLLVRRMIGDVLEIKGLLILPAVLTIIGIFQLNKITSVTPTLIAFVALGFGASIVLGLVRGMSIHLGEKNGVLWMRYGWVSLSLWLLNFAVKGVLFPVEKGISSSAASAADRTILLSIGLGIFAENAVVVLRAMRTKSVVVWEKGQNGGPHKHNPDFDRARSWVNGGFDTSRQSDAGRRVRFPQRDW